MGENSVLNSKVNSVQQVVSVNKHMLPALYVPGTNANLCNSGTNSPSSFVSKGGNQPLYF